MAAAMVKMPTTARLGAAVPMARPSRVPSLPKARPALPRRAARGQGVAARAAAYICVDCGYIYDEATPFEKAPSSYKCPVCNAPKRRFKPYAGPKGRNDPKSMKARMQDLKAGGGASSGSGSDSGSAVAIAVGGAVLLAALYFGLNGYYQ